MENVPMISVEELAEIKNYVIENGAHLETILAEYKVCMKELLEYGIVAGEVHDSLVLVMQSAERLTDKFNMLSTMINKKIDLLETAIVENDIKNIY